MAAMSFVQMLRLATAADHQAVDDRYGGFRLDDAADYRAFLQAHARALPAVEAVLRGDPDLPAWRPRTGLLAGLPSTYLSARHLPGEWRTLLATIEAQAAAESDTWREAAVHGARACFALYGAAAAPEDDGRG